MNAKEAKELAKKGTTASVGEMNSILLKIEIAAKGGDTSTWWYDKFLQGQESWLIKNGYSVKDMSDRDGTLIEISWANPKATKS